MFGKMFFSIIYCGKTVRSIFIKFQGWRTIAVQIELENREYSKSLYFNILGAGKNGLRQGAGII